MNKEKIFNILFGENKLELKQRRFISFLLIVTAIVLLWIPHPRSFLWFTFTASGFRPDLLSGLLGLAVSLPLYVRRIFRWEGATVYSILSFAVNLTLMATVCKLVLGRGFVFGVEVAIMLAAIILSWLGMRAVAGMAWILLIIMGFVSVLYRNYILGFSGYLFILCSFLGILLHADISPAEAFTVLKEEFIGGNATLDRIRSDIKNTGRSRKKR